MNTELIQKVYDQITNEPMSLYQDIWLERDACKTTACIAGWTVMLGADVDEEKTFMGSEDYSAGSVVLKNGDVWAIDVLARKLLAVEVETAYNLFYKLHAREEVLDVLSFALAGNDEDAVNERALDLAHAREQEEI